MGRAVVVGGGTSGLAAAFVLEKAGADCEVVEKRDFAGGRIASVSRDGFTLDLGAQFFFSRYRATFDILERLGAADELVRFRPRIGVVRDGERYALSMDLLENLLHPLAAARAGRLLSGRAKLGAARFALATAALGRRLDFDEPRKAIGLDGRSFGEYARSRFGEEFLEYVAQPIASTLTLGMPEDISAAHGLALAHYMPPGLFTLKNGIGYLAGLMAGSISSLKLNTPASRIVLEGGKVRGVEVGTGKKKETIEADSVICTVPATCAADLLPDLPPRVTGLLRGVRYSACTHVMLAFEKRPLGDVFAFATPRREGFCFSGITENSLKAPGYAPGECGIVHVYTYHDYAREMLEMPDEVVLRRVIRELKRIEPAVPDEPIFCEIFRWPEALCLASPGHIASVARLEEALEDYSGLYLAGEYFGTPSAEAAIHSGVRASERVLAV